MAESYIEFGGLIAKSQRMQSIFETVKRLAKFTTTVLIVGESGTGKELIAKAIHEHSPRKNKPFIAINCGAIPENLMESEFFGHKKGSFTDASRDKKGLFEEAHNGTIFLDEIGELPLALQVKLLRALQEQQIKRVGDEHPIDINVRVVAATLRNLEEDVKIGRFRDDLFYRLNVVAVEIPPLRERRDDIALLANVFVQQQCERFGIPVKKIPEEVMDCLLHSPWRGNVRELENCIERAVVLSEKGTLDLAVLPAHIKESIPHHTDESDIPAGEEDSLSIKIKTRSLEISLISKALKKTKGNRTHAAKILEISHRALLYKLKEYNLEHL